MQKEMSELLWSRFMTGLKGRRGKSRSTRLFRRKADMRRHLARLMRDRDGIKCLVGHYLYGSE
jgi:hypothetical protein